ncbi:MAG: DMT family transporter [bacterium]|nr:DMT family transporter [bacterium]
MTDKKKAYILAGLVVLCWSTVASAFKISLRYFSVLELLFYSSLTSTLALAIILAARKKLSLLKTLPGKAYLQSSFLGFLNPFLYYLMVFEAYNLLPAQMAQPLNMTWGIILVLISIPMLKQKVTFTTIFAFLVCMVGVLVISTEGNITSFQVKSSTGLMLALGSAFVWAFYWVINIKDKQDALVRLFVNFLFGTVFILVAFLFTSSFQVPSWAGLLGAVYIGLFEMGLAFAMWMKALKLAPAASDIAILIYAVPFISFFFIALFVGETIKISSVAGAALIIAGILIDKKRPATREG